MRYKFYREHKYVSSALNSLERLIARTDFSVRSQREKVQEELDLLIQMLEGHAHYENEKLHALLQKKGSLVFENAQKDHEHQDEQLAHLHQLLQNVMEAKGKEEQIEAGYQFYLSYRKFVSDNLAHLHEEETIILPELQRLYSDEELKSVEATTYRIMTEGELIGMMEVLFPHMNPSDREVFLTDIKDAAPEKFTSAWKGIKPVLDLEEQEYFIQKFRLETPPKT